MTDPAYIVSFVAWGGTLCASIGVPMAAISWMHRNGVGPLRAISRGVDYARAAGYLACEMADGARARLGRFPECLARARRER